MLQAPVVVLHFPPLTAAQLAQGLPPIPHAPSVGGLTQVAPQQQPVHPLVVHAPPHVLGAPGHFPAHCGVQPPHVPPVQGFAPQLAQGLPLMPHAAAVGGLTQTLP